MNEVRINPKKNIMILGGGFGGVACAIRLNKLMKQRPTLLKDFNIILVDKKNYHLYTPALYEVASSAADDGAPLNLKRVVVTPLEEIAKDTAIKFIQGAAIKVDVEKKEIRFDDDTAVEYEHLVLALGSEPAYFGIPGLKEYSIPLKSFENAIHIRSVIRKKYEEKQNGAEINIIVGGAGPAGTELSAELIGYIKRLNQKSRKNIASRVTLVEGAPDILPGFSAKIVLKARARLAKIGVKVKSFSIISKTDARFIYIKEEAVPYDALIWTGGVEACSLTRVIGLKEEKRGRMETNSCLQCTPTDQHLDIAENVYPVRTLLTSVNGNDRDSRRENAPIGRLRNVRSNGVYAIGDNTCFLNPQTKMPAPGTARVAIEQAKVAAENIFRKITNRPKIEYKLKNYPFAIPLGGKYAITQIGPMLFVGFSGWILKQLIELYYLFSITDNRLALLRWIRGLGIFAKND
ncbi:MAG TPA: NAD(P)/FAD-dependent oxidoreductase [Candidatus Paceibacterota bacterium]